MLTSVNEVTEKIIGIELGADDYITKPFNTRELLARIKAALRRATMPTLTDAQDNNTPRNSKLMFAGWTLDTATRQLINPEQLEVILTSGEYDLLLVLLEHPNRVVSRDMLLDLTRHRSAGVFDRSIDIQVSRLRLKLRDDPKTPQLIKTIRNAGYMFSAIITKQ